MYCFSYFRALRLFSPSNSAVCVGGGAKTFFALGAVDLIMATPLCADYGTSRKFQKYDVINAVAELPQNHSNYFLNTTTAC